MLAEAFSGRQGPASQQQDQQQQQQQPLTEQQEPSADGSEPQISDQMFAQLVQVSLHFYGCMPVIFALQPPLIHIIRLQPLSSTYGNRLYVADENTGTRF